MESRSRTALEELLAQGAWARRLAHSLVGEAAAADDLVQEAWRAALERPPALDRPVRPWLGRVLTNLARHRARGAGRRAARERAAARDESLPGPDELAERLDSQRALTEELGALAEPFRTTVLLCYFEDLEPSEIARRQNLPAGTVRWRLKRGLDLLRERLDRRFGGRRQWALLLVPLARPPVPFGPLPIDGVPGADVASGASPTVVTSGGTGAALAGAWIVSTTTKVVLASAALGVAYFGLAWSGALPARMSPWPKEAPLQVSFRPLEDVQMPAEAAPVELAAPLAARRAAASAPAPAPEEPAATAAASTDVTLVAGVFDEAGAPLAGGSLCARYPVEASSNPSGTDGRLELTLEDEPIGSLQSTLSLVVERQGFASELVTLRAELGSTVQLGNFRLKPGGAISGRVVDGAGRGLDRILITTGSTGDEPGQLDWNRYEFYAEGAASAWSGPDGSFLLGGVAEGFPRVWASGDGWLASYSAPVEVRAGQESMGVELVLEPLPDECLVRGRVVDTGGSGVAYADLSFRKESENRSMTGSVPADADGRFRFVLPPGMRLSLVASDPAGELGSASAQDLTGGPVEQILRLAELRRAGLLVSGAEGELLERFAMRVRSAADDSLLLDLETAEHAEGRAEFSVPSMAFVIEARAPGHSEERIGPLAPASVGASVEIALAPLPGLRGRVVAGGEPLAGAQVRLYAEADPEVHIEHNGFEVTVDPSWRDQDHSDDEGRFLLTPRARGRYLVRAERAGFAPTELGPIEVDPLSASDELSLELHEGGAIAGRVRVPPGPDASGRIVGISRGDAHARTQRTGADGSFRFEHLTPGPWQVRLVDEEIYATGSHISTSRGSARPPIRFDCRVEEGRTTAYDIDLGGGDERRLAGVLRIDGQSPGPWQAALSTGPLFGGSPEAECAVDVEGRFELVAPATGSYQLVLMGTFGERGLQALVAPVEITEGTTPWSLDLATASLTVENVPMPAGSDPERVHLWQGPDELLCLTGLVPDADGNCVVPRVPLGPGRLIDLSEQHRTTPDPREWTALLTCEVRAGVANRVTLP
jgi:RNA polymerase sigma factor (sigma-70 family)